MANETKPEEQIVDTEMVEQEQLEEVLEADKIIVVSSAWKKTKKNYMFHERLTIS